MKEAMYECRACGAFFGVWGPHCSHCGMEEPTHDCDDCPGWPDRYQLQVQEALSLDGQR